MERQVLCLMGGPALKAGVLKWCCTDTDTKEPKELPEIGYCTNEVLDSVINDVDQGALGAFKSMVFF